MVPWAQDLLLALDNKELDFADYDLDQWRLMHIGAQPVPPSLIKHWKEYFPNHQYDTNYGLSESIGPGCVHLGLDHIDKVGAIGKAGYGWEAKIIDEQGETVKQGETGELAVKGPGVMTCYYRDPQATAEALHDGWLYTETWRWKTKTDLFFWLTVRKMSSSVVVRISIRYRLKTSYVPMKLFWMWRLLDLQITVWEKFQQQSLN